MYLLRELVDGDVGWGADEDLPAGLLGQVVDDGGRGDRLARAGRSLDQAQRALQHRLHRVHLKHNTNQVRNNAWNGTTVQLLFYTLWRRSIDGDFNPCLTNC